VAPAALVTTKVCGSPVIQLVAPGAYSSIPDADVANCAAPVSAERRTPAMTDTGSPTACVRMSNDRAHTVPAIA
jgi:hypothetical protein